MNSIARVRRAALRALTPPPRLALDEWIESELRLPAGVSALPGRVTLWPFQREIAQAIGDPAIERVTLVKSVRVGLSTLLAASIGSHIANEPAPIMLLMPTEADCRDVVVSDLEPIFDATPALRGLLSDDQPEGERNTLLSRRFPGGSLKIVAAKAPRNLRRHNVRVLLIDEADAMETGAEGSPIALAERRTLSFANRKIVIGSTPVYDDGHVMRSYAASDQRIFEVPCPECGGFNEIAWKDIQWPEGEPEKAHYVCSSCGAVTEERRKVEMVSAGRWRATAPHVTGHAGFRVNALVSPHVNASWNKLAAEFLRAKSSPDTLRVFVNTILAQGWRDEGEEIDERDLCSRREPFGLSAIPADVLIVTVGVDAQDDRLEVVLLGHSRDAALVLAHRVIWGPLSAATTWEELDDLLRASWPHANGGTLRVDAACVDSSDGDHQQHVYGFTRPRFGRRIVAVKGVP